MKKTKDGFAGGTGKAFIALGFLQLALATGAHAWADYGWMGLIVYIVLAFPAAPIFFFAGWFFLPFSAVAWVYAFVAVGLGFMWFATKGRQNV